MTKQTPPPETSTAPEDDYFLEIESHFAARRGTPFLFSAKDWALMKGWREEGIPLAIVLEAMDQCFDTQAKSGRRRVISSLSYCRHAVKEVWDERRALQVGGEGSVPEMDPVQQLNRLAESLRAVASETDLAAIAAEIRTCADQIASRARGKSVPQIEDDLSEVEHDLLERIAVRLPAEETKRIDDEIAAMLDAYPIDDEALRAKTREANFRRLLRRRIGLPRLSLFG
ncbi:MAG TPA: hypothetical protein VIL97_01745 [Thermoanaerobaculia bacterium]